MAPTRRRLIVGVFEQVKKTLINLALFQLGWLVCVLGGNVYAAVFTVLALLLHQWLVLDNRREWMLIAVIVLGGCLWDIAMAQFGVVRFANALPLGIPLWLVCLWVLFATTLCTAWRGCATTFGWRRFWPEYSGQRATGWALT